MHGESRYKTEEKQQGRLVCLSYQPAFSGKCCIILARSKAIIRKKYWKVFSSSVLRFILWFWVSHSPRLETLADNG